MRLFTAIDIPEAVREKLRGLMAELMPTAPLKWSVEANWHITTKFVGEFSDSAAMEAALATVRVPAFDVEIRGLGWYPNPHQPSVFFAGVAAPEELGDLHDQTDAVCGRLGIPRETKRYSPYLTLARIKMPVPLAALREVIGELPTIDFGKFHVGSFWLYASRMGTEGSVYRKLKEFPLG